MKLTITTQNGVDIEAAPTNEPVSAVAEALERVIRDGASHLSLTTSTGARVIIPRDTLMNSVITIAQK